MYAQASPKNQPRESLGRRLFNYLVPKLLSGHGKRILFITSLYFELTPVKSDEPMNRDVMKLHDDAIERLNEVMDVAKSTSALRFPAMFRGLIWRGCNVRDIVSEEDFLSGVTADNVVPISERLVDAMPPALRYETRPNMVSEVVKLLSNGPRLAHAA